MEMKKSAAGKNLWHLQLFSLMGEATKKKTTAKSPPLKSKQSRPQLAGDEIWGGEHKG